MRSYYDLAVIISFLCLGILLNISQYAPAIVAAIDGNVCHSIIVNIVHTALFGSNVIYTCLYLLYLVIIPKDAYKSVYVSRILAALGIPNILFNASVAAICLPGCYYNIPIMTICSYAIGGAVSTYNLFYMAVTGSYSIFRWSRGL